MLERKNYRFDEQGRLVRDKYYFLNFLIFKYVLSYSKGIAVATLYLFGILPVWRFYPSSLTLAQKSILSCGGGADKPRCFTPYGSRYSTSTAF